MTSPRVRKKLIRTRLAEATIIEEVKPESVASILEHDIEITIQNWRKLVEQDVELTRIPLSRRALVFRHREMFARGRRDTGHGI